MQFEYLLSTYYQKTLAWFEWLQLILCRGKLAGLKKDFRIIQNFMHEAAQTTFCSLESPGYSL